MKYTEHYGLKKPDVDDFYDIGDHNANSDVIDGQLHQMQESVNGLSERMVRAVAVMVPAAGWQVIADVSGDAGETGAGETGTGETTGSGYTVTVPVEGMTDASLPVVLPDISGAISEAEEKVLKRQYGWISWYDTADGAITFTARFHQPTVDLILILKGV